MSAPDCASAILVTAALGGKQSGFAELMRLHSDAVYRLARTYTGDPEEALDITQEAFASAFDALRRYDRSRSFRTWILRIAINKCHDWSRRRAVRKFFTFAIDIDQARAVAENAALPDQMVADAIELRLVSAAISKLPVRLKESIILRTIDGLTQVETAQVLGISEKAVETRLHRARAKLIEMLGDRNTGNP